MLARLHVILPFSFTLPDGENYNIYSYIDGNYRIQFYPPLKSDHPAPGVEADVILINDRPSFEANALKIDFFKDDFDRRKSTDCDPPHEFIQKTINLFLERVRCVARGHQIKPIGFPIVTWKIEYLHDDGTALEQNDGNVRARFGQAMRFSFIALTKEVWNDAFSIPFDSNLPEWDSIYLDAINALPHVGVAVILASTSLEVFISSILNKLAQNKITPQSLWDWINKRNEWLKEPSTEEQFDNLLKMLLGVSLKENHTLWEAFKNLKKARNSFVHEGIAKLGQNIITVKEATKLVNQSLEIIQFIKAKLPNEMQWPEFKHVIKIEFQKKIAS